MLKLGQNRELNWQDRKKLNKMIITLYMVLQHEIRTEGKVGEQERERERGRDRERKKRKSSGKSIRETCNLMKSAKHFSHI